MKDRVGAIVPYRMLASRLPDKPLRDIAGRPAVDRVVERILRCRHINSAAQVMIATTTDASDDRLCDYAASKGWRVHRGSVDDVLERMAEAAEALDVDIVVEADGDDLLCATEYMDLGVEALVQDAADWVSFKGLPIGATPNILRTSALKLAVEKKPYRDTATGFFRFLSESGLFQNRQIEVANPAHRHDTVRMTLDYPQDQAFFSEIYCELDTLGGDWTFADLISLLHRRPDIVSLNAGLDGAYEQHFQSGVARSIGSADRSDSGVPA